MAAIDARRFRVTLTDELRAAWRALRAAHAGERFYSFGLYTAPCAEYLTVTAGTEEGLARATAAAVGKRGGDPALRRASLRWSLADSPLHAEGDGLLPKSGALRDAGPDPYDDSPEGQAAVKLVFDGAVAALLHLDREGIFGTGAEREALVLGVWYGDQPDEERVEYARMLNPGPIADRLERELAEADEAFNALQ
jgi:hypothetical protein